MRFRVPRAVEIVVIGGILPAGQHKATIVHTYHLVMHPLYTNTWKNLEESALLVSETK